MKQAPHVKFRPMTTPEFDLWLPVLSEEYAADLVKAGFATEANVEEKVETQLKQMLKDGLETKDNHLYIVQDADSNEPVGKLWIVYQKAEEKKQCFVGDVEIDEQYRRQGYGRATMLHCETIAKAENAQVLRLHVFGFNTPAISLYADMGYVTLSQQMEKTLD